MMFCRLSWLAIWFWSGAQSARIQEIEEFGEDEKLVSNSTDAFKCPPECQECAHGRGLPHQAKHKKEFQCRLKLPYDEAKPPAGRDCKCPYGWKCEGNKEIARSRPDRTLLNSLEVHNMGITQCKFAKVEVEDKAWETMLTKESWISDRYRCCCGKMRLSTQAACISPHARPQNGTIIYSKGWSGVNPVLLEGSNKKLHYGKTAVASGRPRGNMVPVHGDDGMFPINQAKWGVELFSEEFGKTELFVPREKQTFANKDMACQTPGTQARSYQRNWQASRTRRGCCVATQGRVHVESYTCGDYYDYNCECRRVRYCQRSHHWTACVGWEQVYHCGLASQTGLLAVRVDTSPGLCIGDRSTLESLEEQYGRGVLSGYAVDTEKKDNFNLRYNAKKAKRKTCPINWAPKKKMKNFGRVLETEFGRPQGPMREMTWFCSCDNACHLSHEG